MTKERDAVADTNGSSSKQDTLHQTICSIRSSMEETHDSGINHSLQWRLDALACMQRMVSENHQAFATALKQDLGKLEAEAYATEILLVQSEIALFQKHLATWLTPTQVPSPMACLPARSHVEYKPLSSPGVLVLGPFNYPLLLCLQPVIGSLAAGNPTLLKPSELCPATSQLLQSLISQYFDKGVLQCLTGGVVTAQALLQHSWGKIFFTGSTRVGRIVAKAAAATLTPVVLELGGKCPAVVDETCHKRHLNQVAHRIVWAKTMNAGQTCASVDYLLVHESHLQQLCEYLVQALQTQFGPSATELGRIVSVEHAARLHSMILEVEEMIANEKRSSTASSCKILTGGSHKNRVNDRLIFPTLIVNPPKSCRLMEDEVFGPVLPIFSFSSRSDAIHFVKQIPLTPLCKYIFTSRSSVYDDYNVKIPSGSAMRNDCLISLLSHALPFGGLGTSGHGNYHGKYSLETFSHKFASMHRPLGVGLDWGNVRCHPFVGQPVKELLLRRMITDMPYVPVLLTKRNVVLGAMVVVAASCCMAPQYSGLARSNDLLRTSADLLEHAAKWVRGQIE
ncbi:hypothetical protein MPSEU_000764100 [Mayamaea pseudoterrestris]|nr:hypothetical protein MPSEU_000764100 [Mayamaea pseudoterrestris]